MRWMTVASRCHAACLHNAACEGTAQAMQLIGPGQAHLAERLNGSGHCIWRKLM